MSFVVEHSYKQPSRRSWGEKVSYARMNLHAVESATDAGDPDRALGALAASTVEVGRLAAARIDELRAEVRRLRAASAEQRGVKAEALRSMAPDALAEVGRVGLLSSAEVDAEIHRRVEPLKRNSWGVDTGAVVSGRLPCMHAGCNVACDVATTQWCAEHEPPIKHQWIDGDFRLVDLDAAAAETQERVADLRRRLEEAEAEQAIVQRRIEQYDASHG